MCDTRRPASRPSDFPARSLSVWAQLLARTRSAGADWALASRIPMVRNGFAAGNKASTPLTNAEQACYWKKGYPNDTDRLGGRLPVDEGGWFYAGVSGRGVFRSTDGGRTWSQLLSETTAAVRSAERTSVLHRYQCRYAIDLHPVSPRMRRELDHGE